MSSLTTCSHPIFTDNTLKLLEKYNLNNFYGFVRESSEKIRKILNVSLTEVLGIKKHLLRNCGTAPESAFAIYKNVIQHSDILPTNIKSLDNLLEGGLSAGDLIDLCGHPGSGKTHLCTAIAINTAYHLNFEILYIDTKHDFSSKRLRNILQARMFPEIEIGHTMLKIKLQSVYSLQKLLVLLMNVNRMLFKDTRLKIVVIDSLPALLHLYLGDKRFEGITLLAKLTALMRKMATEHHLVFITINLITTWTELLNKKDTFYVENKESNIIRMKTPSLGKYWKTIPCVRLLMEGENQLETTPQTSYFNLFVHLRHTRSKASDLKKSATSYSIKVLKSDSCKVGNNSVVSLSKQGIITEDFHSKTHVI